MKKLFWILMAGMMLLGSQIYLSNSKTEKELNLFSTPYIAAVRSSCSDQIPKHISEEDFWNYSIHNTTPKELLQEQGKANKIRFDTICELAKKLDIPSAQSYQYHDTILWGDIQKLLEIWEDGIKKEMSSQLTDLTVLNQYYLDNLKRYQLSDEVTGLLTVWENGTVTATIPIHYDHHTHRSVSEKYYNTVARLETLKAGENATWTENNIQLQIQCTSRIAGAYPPFDEIKEAVHSQYVDEYFQNYISNSIKNNE